MPSLHVRLSASLFLLALAVPLGATPGTAEPPPPAPGLLEQIRQKLERLRTALVRTERSTANAEQALAEAEQSLAAADREISGNEKAIREANQALAELESRRIRAESRIRQEREDRERWLRATYLLGPSNYLKMLLNQENPRRASLLAGDFQYLMRQRGLEIAAWQSALADLAVSGRHVEARRRELAGLAERQAASRERLAALKLERARALSALQRQERSEQERIEELKRAEQRLSAVVENLRRADAVSRSPELTPIPKTVPGAALPAAPGSALLPDEMQVLIPEGRPASKPADPGSSPGGFAASKGRLPLPLDQMPVIRYGQPRPPGSTRTQGLVFHADEGAPVRAVARGRLVYADWLKGFGLLLIVDHGDGYMSLYGHNRSTDRRVGEAVEAGEVIARVGESGGQDRPTLYFEIRHQGRPDDPLLWCRAP